MFPLISFSKSPTGLRPCTEHEGGHIRYSLDMSWCSNTSVALTLSERSSLSMEVEDAHTGVFTPMVREERTDRRWLSTRGEWTALLTLAAITGLGGNRTSATDTRYESSLRLDEYILPS